MALYFWSDLCFSGSVTWSLAISLCCYETLGQRCLKGKCREWSLCNLAATQEQVLELPNPSALPLTILAVDVFFFHLFF